MAEDDRELYCILLPLGDGKLLLPRAIVEEVRAFAPPDPVPGAPPWLLGRVAWRGGKIPLVAVEPLIGEPLPESSRRMRMVIVHAPADTLEPPAMAILAQGFPYILRVTPGLLTSTGMEPAEGLLAELNFGYERPVVPDLPALAAESAQILSGA